MWSNGVLQLRIADDASILSDLIIDAALLVDQKRAQELRHPVFLQQPSKPALRHAGGAALLPDAGLAWLCSLGAVIQDAVAEGQAIGLPPTHDHRAALAERARQKSAAPFLVVGDLKIEGVMGIRLPPIENGVLGPERPPRQWSCLQWIEVALRDLWEIAQTRADLALGVVREWLADVRRHVVRFGDTVQARPLVASVAAKILLLRHCSIDSGISGGGSERSTGILCDLPAADGGVQPPGA